jgi:hypothetical protein
MTKFGQCNCQKIPGKDFCKMHAGRGNAQEENTRNYRLTKWQAQLERMGDNPGLKSLRDELAILRMLMEERLNLCKDSHDLLLQSHTISDLATKIERLVVSCSRLDVQLGKMLDKTAIINFANEVIAIIGEEVKDSKALDAIATKIISSLEKTGG